MGNSDFLSSEGPDKVGCLLGLELGEQIKVSRGHSWVCLSVSATASYDEERGQAGPSRCSSQDSSLV